MARFLKLSNGVYVNLDTIAYVGPGTSGDTIVQHVAAPPFALPLTVAGELTRALEQLGGTGFESVLGSLAREVMTGMPPLHKGIAPTTAQETCGHCGKVISEEARRHGAKWACECDPS